MKIFASSEEQAIAQVQSLHPNAFLMVNGTGGHISQLDICVYESESECNQDAEENDNLRVINRYKVRYYPTSGNGHELIASV